LLAALQLSGRSRRAQQADQVWRIGVLMQLGEGDPQSRVEVDVLLKELGCSEGRPAQIDTEVCLSSNTGGDQGGQNEMLTLNASYRS
jgi:hypothetical protein